MFETILWASDGSDHADRALTYARDLAQRIGSKIVVIHVKEIMLGRAGGYPVQADEDEVEEKVQRQAKELSDAGINATYEEAVAGAGGAAHAIAEAARDAGADVIVVGTRGQAPLSGLLLGSVTNRLLHIAHCPVLAVPPE